MKKVNLRNQLNRILNKYISAFSEKHGIEFDYAIGDDLMNILCFHDYFVNITDVIHDIDNDSPKGVFFEWYNATLSNVVSADFDKSINYNSWCMGLRYTDLVEYKKK